MNLVTLFLAAAIALPPLKPVQTIPLASHGSAAADVAWLNDREVLVALSNGGVVKVNASSGASQRWLADSPPPAGVPHPELIAADGATVVITGAQKVVQVRRADGSLKSSHGPGGGLNPRGAAVTNSGPVLLGWMTRTGTDAEQQRGALWREDAARDLSVRPIHRILGGAESVARWRQTMHPYGGATTTLADGSVALVTSAEPGVFIYGRDGRLKSVLGSRVDALIVEASRLLRDPRDIIGRYSAVLDQQPTIDDLVATPQGPAILARIARAGRVHWELWRPGAATIEHTQRLEPQVFGPIAHMKCDARGARMACVTNRPSKTDAAVPGRAASNPTLLLFRLAP